MKRITITLLFALSFHSIMAQSSYLDQLIQLNETEISLQQLITVIETQTDFRFSFNPSTLPLQTKITFKENKISIKQALNSVTKTLGLNSIVKDKIILLKKEVKQNEKRASIYGYIRDAQSRENLIAATIVEKGTAKGTTSNSYGYFSYEVPLETYVELLCSYVGYQPALIKLKVTTDTLIIIGLVPQLLDAVEVIANKHSFESEQMSVIRLTPSLIKSVPTLLGEADVIKVAQMLPGVQRGTEGSTNFFVRGGDGDENLILIDGVPVYNVSHIFGFLSLFNPSSINSVEVYKGGFSAKYGGRLSSVMDIRMKEGNTQDLKGEVTAGLISSGILLEGPLISEKSSFHISARRSILGDIFKLINPEDYFGYNFSDINSKVTYKVNDNNQLFLNFYLGNDNGEFGSIQTISTDRFKFGWGNKIGTIRWNTTPSPKLFVTSNILFSSYKYGRLTESISGNNDEFQYKSEYYSQVQDIGFNTNLEWEINSRSSFVVGGEITKHFFVPGSINKDLSINSTKVEKNSSQQKANSIEYAIYAENNIQLGKRIGLSIGLRGSGFGNSEKYFHHIDPRIHSSFLLNPDWCIKSSLSFMTQYIHQVTNSGIGLPINTWVQSNEFLLPKYSWQYGLATSHTIYKKLNLSIEGYYKESQGQASFKPGVTGIATAFNGWEQNFEQGQGRSYGVELLLEKKEGSLTGFLGYSLARTIRQFDNLNGSLWHPFRFDRRHSVSGTVGYAISEKISIASTWIYQTGEAITIPNYAYEAHADLLPLQNGTMLIDDTTGDNVSINSLVFLPSSQVFGFGERNSYRMPNYHRLDLGVTFEKKKKRGTRLINFSIYNVYNKKNPFAIKNKTTNAIMSNNYTHSFVHTATYVESIFPIIPSVNYTFKFE